MTGGGLYLPHGYHQRLVVHSSARPHGAEQERHNRTATSGARAEAYAPPGFSVTVVGLKLTPVTSVPFSFSSACFT